MSFDRWRDRIAWIAVVGGGFVFAASLAGFLWHYRPAGRLGVDAGAWRADAGWPAVGRNVALFSAFALHHSVMARPGVKRAIARVLSPRYERSVYVWISSVLFACVWWFWQPVPGRLWQTDPPLAWILVGVQAVGAIMTLLAARRIDVLELSGMRQGLALAPREPARLVRTGLYGLVRHPIYLAWLLLVWFAPDMSGTRATFAAVSTLYLVAAIPIEERGLDQAFGPAYAAYRRRTRWRLLPFIY